MKFNDFKDDLEKSGYICRTSWKKGWYLGRCNILSQAHKIDVHFLCNELHEFLQHFLGEVPDSDLDDWEICFPYAPENIKFGRDF